MSRDERLVGRPMEEVVEAVVARDPDRDPDDVRAVLDPITEDGVVSAAVIDSAVSDTSKVVSTAETRTELARLAYDDACALAEAVTDLDGGVTDLDVVAARLDSFAERLEAVEERAADLPTDLADVVERSKDPSEVFELGLALRQVASTAQGVVRTADDLAFDVEQFQSWLENPARRYDEFEEDVAIVAESLDDLETALDRFPDGSDDPAADWAQATMRVRVSALLVTDLAAELEAYRAWADRIDEPFPTDRIDDVYDLEARCESIADRLDELARPSWRERFADRLEAVGNDLDAVEPPVQWEAVKETIDAHRHEAFDDTT